jgi:hypothetical protein
MVNMGDSNPRSSESLQKARGVRNFRLIQISIFYPPHASLRLSFLWTVSSFLRHVRDLHLIPPFVAWCHHWEGASELNHKSDNPIDDVDVEWFLDWLGEFVHRFWEITGDPGVDLERLEPEVRCRMNDIFPSHAWKRLPNAISRTRSGPSWSPEQARHCQASLAPRRPLSKNNRQQSIVSENGRQVYET